MTKRLLVPTQSDVNEAALDGVQLVQELGLHLEDADAKRIAGRKAMLMNGVNLLSILSLYAGPIVMYGWKNH